MRTLTVFRGFFLFTPTAQARPSRLNQSQPVGLSQKNKPEQRLYREVKTVHPPVSLMQYSAKLKHQNILLLHNILTTAAIKTATLAQSTHNSCCKIIPAIESPHIKYVCELYSRVCSFSELTSFLWTLTKHNVVGWCTPPATQIALPRMRVQDLQDIARSPKRTILLKGYVKKYLSRL